MEKNGTFYLGRVKMPYLIGLDIGGTKCAVLLAEVKNGIHIVDKIRFDTETQKGFEYTKNNLFKAVRDILINNKIDFKLVEAIGVSCGGPLDSKRGLVLSPPNLPGWDNVPIVDMLEKEFNVPAFVQNDANACALVEWKLGAGKGTNNMMFLTMGTGMGAGIIAEGKLLVGASDMGGEVGHIRLEEDGPVGYGKAGSFEGYCSGGGIARLAQQKAEIWLKEGKSLKWCRSLNDIKNIDTRLVSDSAKAGDLYAQEVFKLVGEKLGKALSIFIDTLNPEAIVIGSIFGRSGELLRESMEKVIEKETLIYSRKVCKVLPAGMGESIGDLASIMVAAYGLELDIETFQEDDNDVLKHYDRLFTRYPELDALRTNVFEAYRLIYLTYKNGGKVLACGNGGSAADSEHIIGELMKGFFKMREIPKEFVDKLKKVSGDKAADMSKYLQGALPAIALTQHNALSTAFLNDVSAEMVFAQQVYGYGVKNDILIAISTSGNSKNVVNAAVVAKAKGMKVVALTGPGGGKLKEISDVLINVPGECTADIQEFHLPVYHTLCAMIEEKLF
jgi:glucokinase